MTNNPLISIIVPIFNVEKYLERCLEPLANQTYRTIEILLVDDGSTDDSSRLADGYFKKDKRVKVIHKENGGVSSARNAGLKEARGEYVMFVDADDKVDVHTCEICVKYIKSNVDFVSFTAKRVDKRGRGNIKEGKVDGSVECLNSNKEIIKDYLNSDNLRVVAHLFRSKTLKNLTFDTSMRIHEDALFAFKLLERSNTAIKINIPLYVYISRSDSAMKHFFVADILDVRKHYKEVVSYINTHYPELKKDVLKHSMATLFNLLTIAKLTKSKPDVTQTRNDIRRDKKTIGGGYKLLHSHQLKLFLSYLPLPVFKSVLWLARKIRRVV